MCQFLSLLSWQVTNLSTFPYGIKCILASAFLEMRVLRARNFQNSYYLKCQKSREPEPALSCCREFFKVGTCNRQGSRSMKIPTRECLQLPTSNRILHMSWERAWRTHYKFGRNACWGGGGRCTVVMTMRFSFFYCSFMFQRDPRTRVD